MNEKTESRHLERLACVYVRQSSMSQVRNHGESRRRQMGLTGTAKQLGWTEQRIRVIDEDQGKSGTNTGDRPGYQQLLGLVAEGRVGVVLAVDVSRLARDDVAWQQMVRHCVFADVLLADETHVYDPKDQHDRMMLGMLGTLAEYELGTLRKRMQQSYRQKAERGELYGACAPGYVVEAEHLVIAPDARVRHVLDTLFGLLYSSGVRIGEAMAFDLENVCADSMRLHIRNSKFRKERWVPLSRSTWRVLQDYIRLRCRLFAPMVRSPLFVNTKGDRLRHCAVYAAFRAVLAAARIRSTGADGPRIHDFRHTFAVRRVLRWYQQGLDVNTLLPALATYMGHVDIASTQVYLQAAGELLGPVNERFHNHFRQHIARRTST